MKVEGSGLNGFRLGSTVYNLGCGVSGLGFRVWTLGARVEGSSAGRRHGNL